MGDVKLAAVIGLVLGLPRAPLRRRRGRGGHRARRASGGLVALAMGRGQKSAIPFGPYLAAGAVVAGLWGEPLASWYLDRFL